VEHGHLPDRSHNLPVATVLPVAAPAIAVAGYIGILASFWLSFAGDTSAALSISVSTFYGAVFFGIPYFMLRTAAKHGASTERPTLAEFVRGNFDTIYGRIGGGAALVQVAIVPVGLAFGSLAIGLVYVLSF
jgi:hypothetical protein